MQTNSLRTSIVGSLWIIFSKFGQSLGQVIMLVILARLLNPNDFGIVSLAMVFIVLARTVIIQGFSPVLVLRKDIGNGYASTFLGATIFASILISIITAMCASYIGVWFESAELVLVIKLLSLTIVISSVSTIPRALLQREKQFKLISKIELNSYIIGYGIFGISLAFHGLGLYSLVFAYIAQSTIEAVLYLLTYNGTKKAQFDYHEWRNIFRLVGTYSLSQIGFKLNQQVDQIILSKLGGMEILGLYGRAKQLLMFPINIMAGVADKVTFPMLVRSKTDHEFREVFGLFFYGFLSISLASSTFLFFNSRFIVNLTLGEGWDSVTPMFEALALSLPIRVLSYVIYTAIKAKGQIKSQILVSYMSTIAIIVFSIVAYPIFGALGTIYSYISVTLIVFILYAIILNNKIVVFNLGTLAKFALQISLAIICSTIILSANYMIESKSTFLIFSSSSLLIFFSCFFLYLNSENMRVNLSYEDY